MKKTIPILFAIALLGTTAFLLTTRGGDLKANSPTSSANVQTATTASTVGQTRGSQSMMSSGLKDGTYNGAVASNEYEDVAVTITISSGQIVGSSMAVSNMGERESSRIISRAEKSLNSQAVAVQNAHIDGVSGATSTSESYAQSLQSAIDKARQT